VQWLRYKAMGEQNFVGQNKILARLPDHEALQIVSQMQLVSPKIGEVVAQPGTPPKWVHFPISLILSSVVILENGATVEGATIGREGMDGLWVLAPSLPNPYRIVVQVGGQMLRISAHEFTRVLQEIPSLAQLLIRYAFVLIQRGTQNAACIKHHTIEQRMCRWLLETANRKGQDQFHMTQEFLGGMLGVRRQSVNQVAGVLQQAKLIQYHRGELTILERARLEAESCECFRVTAEIYKKSMKF
jgi:CRP-like cAMP-binding protein